MKLLIILTTIIYTLSLTSSYYKKCKSGVANIDIYSVSECRTYDPEGGYCCYLTYENPKKSVDIYIYNPNTYSSYKKKENTTRLRSLQEPNYYCYGLSNEGYNNIDDVIDEVSDEGGFSELKIDCGQLVLKNKLNNYLILLIIFIIL